MRALAAIGFALALAGCTSVGASPQRPPAPSSAPDGPVGVRGVLVQRSADFTTTFSNDSIPNFEAQRYDSDGAWSPERPDRIVVRWSEPIILHARAAWEGHTGEYVELKLYCGAERPIGLDQEDRLVAVVQTATNPASPFVELTTPPLLIEPGTECMIAFKTPDAQTLIGYGQAATTFGAYVP